MIHILRVSGEEEAAVPLEDVENVKALKRFLQQSCGMPRFRQRLLHNGADLDDTARRGIHDMLSEVRMRRIVAPPKMLVHACIMH